MDNQHKLIKGYRDLSQEEIDLINEIKELAAAVGIVVDKVINRVEEQFEEVNDGYDGDEYVRLIVADPYSWAVAAKSELQTGFMKLTRAVAQPTTF